MVEQTQFGFEDLKRILVDRVGLAENDVADNRDAAFDEMGLDSLAFVEVQLAMEQEYGFEIEDADAERIHTVGERDRVCEPATGGGLMMAAHTDNSIEINAPLELVWNRMMEVEAWPSLYDNEYAKVEVLERDGDRIVFRLTTPPDPQFNGQVWSWTAERFADPATHTSKSHRIETGPFEYMNIEWSFEETEGGTLMRWVQDFAIKPDAPVDDEQAAQNINDGTRKQMRVIQQRLEALASGTSS